MALFSATVATTFGWSVVAPHAQPLDRVLPAGAQLPSGLAPRLLLLRRWTARERDEVGFLPVVAVAEPQFDRVLCEERTRERAINNDHSNLQESNKL